MAESYAQTTAELYRGRWYVLALLTAIFAVHYVDRGVVAVVVEPIKREFGFSDAAMGILAGFAHSTALSIMVLPMGYLADHVSRVRLISACVIVWSGLTALGGLVNGYAALVLSRAGVGAAEAGGTPASASVIADIFPKRDLPTAMGIYYVAAAVGTGLTFLVGGYVAQHFGWRYVFLIAGLPGIMLGLILWRTVREPKRGAVHEVRQPLSAAARELGRNRTLLFITAGGTAASIAQMAAWTWMTSFFVREHGLSLSAAGLVSAAATGLGMGVGSLLSGPLSRMFARDKPRQLWRFPALMLALSVPAAWAMVSVPSAAIAIAFAILMGVMLGSWIGQASGMLMAGAPPRLRATSMSLYHLCTNLIGVGLGPVLTGAISDLVGNLGSALGWTMSFNLLAALGFFFAARNLPDDIADAAP